MSFEIYIGVGSNLQPEQHILRALSLLGKELRLTATSRFYRTLPLERPDQPAFINGVWQADTNVPPAELKFRILRGVEKALGRKRQADKHAVRQIDLDLLLYGNQVSNQPGLQLPDPDILNRNFLAIPLFEIHPGLVLPDSGLPIAEIVKKMDNRDMLWLPEFSEKLSRIIRRMG